MQIIWGNNLLHLISSRSVGNFQHVGLKYSSLVAGCLAYRELGERMISLVSQQRFSAQKANPAKPIRRGNVSFNGYMEAGKPVVEVGINGFGRIAKTMLREWATTRLGVPLAKQNLTTDRFIAREAESIAKIDIKSINVGRKVSPKSLIHNIKYDSEMGNFLGDVSAERNAAGELWLKIGKKGSKDQAEIRVFEQKDAATIPLDKYNVDIAVDATGKYLTAEKLDDHIKAGALRTVCTAPPKDDSVPVFVSGINSHKLTSKDVHSSSASCTTTAAAGPIKLMHEKYGVEDGFVYTTHCVTGTQVTADKIPGETEKDFGKLRSAFNSIVPSTTGAAKTAGKVIEGLDGKLDGLSARVPNSNGSLVTATLNLKQKVTAEEVKDMFRDAYKSKEYKDILAEAEKGTSTADMSGRHESSLVLTDDIKVINGKKVIVTAYYDNEFGFTRSMMDHIKNVGAKLYESNPERFASAKKLNSTV